MNLYFGKISLQVVYVIRKTQRAFHRVFEDIFRLIEQYCPLREMSRTLAVKTALSECSMSSCKNVNETHASILPHFQYANLNVYPSNHKFEICCHQQLRLFHVFPLYFFFDFKIPRKKTFFYIFFACRTVSLTSYKCEMCILGFIYSNKLPSRGHFCFSVFKSAIVA